MSKYLFILLLLPMLGSSQAKQDYYWPFGLGAQDNLMPFAFDFNVSPFVPVLRESNVWFNQNNASICDKQGNLLFYTNGCAVANRLHEIMPEGDSINAGRWFGEFWGGDCSRGYTGTQDISILPDPGNQEGYYIFHKPTSYKPENPDVNKRFSKDSLQYSYVDMSLDEGRGDVVIKNHTFFRDSLAASYLTAILHDNQEDYWIMNPVFPEGFLVLLLNDEGIESKIIDGPVWDIRKTSSSGHARFSPDGKQFALFNQFDGLYLYDFDRMDGALSEEQHIPFISPETGIFATCEWSPNSRFLYMSKFDTLWQLDTWAEPLDTGLQIIEVKTEPSSVSPNFLVAALGPDCRIYIRGKSSAFTMHVIHKPDELGTACDFQQNGIQLPYISSAGSFPNFPRFRVDEEEKCDPSIVSIVGETVWWRRDLSAYPSPATEHITVELPLEITKGRLYVMDMQGQLIYDELVQGLQQLQLNVSDWSEGTYSVEFLPEDTSARTLWTQRVVKVEE